MFEYFKNRSQIKRLVNENAGLIDQARILLGKIQEFNYTSEHYRGNE